nr:RHS repeat-associated core domain-containing protein [Delftia sp. UME58]
MLSEYLYEPDSFVPLAKLESEWKSEENRNAQAEADKASFATYYYHCDQIGAPQELTDEAGRIVWAASYKVWGQTRQLQHLRTGTDDAAVFTHDQRPLALVAHGEVQSLALVEQPLRFQGQYFDGETGLHYNRFRYYDPVVGRFVHQDPIGLFGGNNFYSYGPSALNFLDPLGLRTGNSTALGKAITGKDNWPGRRAHHILPSEAYDDPKRTGSSMLRALQGCGKFNLDGKGNGIMLPAKKNSATTRSAHSGYHSDYNEAIMQELDHIAATYPCPNDQGKAVQRLQQKLHESLRKGNLELHFKNGLQPGDWHSLIKTFRK